MMLGSFERLEMKRKIKLANQLTSEIISGKEFLDAKFWALSRVCSRRLSYGEDEHIMHPEVVESWATKLLGVQYQYR